MLSVEGRSRDAREMDKGHARGFGLAELLGDNLWARAFSVYVLITFLFMPTECFPES